MLARLFRLQSTLSPSLRSLTPASFSRPQQTRSPTAPRLLLRAPLNIRTMASSSEAPKHEWLVIIPDFDGALEKRLAVRPKHIEGLKPEPDFWLFGGAYLAEPAKEGEQAQMRGSAMLCLASSKEEVLERVKRDVYTQNGVWDVEKLQIYPFRSAIRKAL